MAAAGRPFGHAVGGGRPGPVTCDTENDDAGSGNATAGLEGEARQRCGRMDWFHCNKCYGKPSGTLRFSISSCKHILCHKCIGQDRCSVCGSTCKYLPLSDNMAAHEQMYVRKPSDICRKYLEHLAQVTTFQRKQMELLLAFYKHKVAKMEEALREAHCKIRTQEKESMALKNEMIDMKKLLALTKVSPNIGQLRRSATPRPIAITSPTSWVTPKLTPQATAAHSGTGPPNRPELMLQVSGSSVSRLGGLLMSRGSPATSGRSTPRDIIMSSPMAGSGDSSMYRSLGRTPTLLNIPLSQSQGLGDARLPAHSSAAALRGSYATPLQLLELNGARQTPSIGGSDPRRQIQLNTTPRSVIFRQPPVPPSRGTAV